VVRLFNEVLGKDVDLPDVPERIISFSPAATETLFEIGAGDRVAGVSAFCARPSEARAKRRVGSYNTVRKEVLEEIRPDLILTVTGYQRDFAVSLSRSYPVYPLELPVSVAGIVDFVVKVGLVTGSAERARGLAGTLLRSLGKVRPTRGLVAYVEIDLGGPVTFGAHSYITDALRFLGCTGLYEKERREWLTPDLGEVAVKDPDVIFYEPKMFSQFRDGDLDRLIQSRRWEGLRAVRKENLFVTPRPLDFLAHHGPSFIRDAIPWQQERLMEASQKVG
jgi:iron complex transport system substrate-binding protein